MAFVGQNAAYAKFVPQIYSAKLQDKFYASSIVPAISNHDWEGEIQSYGDKVIIRKVPTISINDYGVTSSGNNKPLNGTGGTGIVYETLTSGGDNLELLIDKSKYYAFRVDYIDDYQSDLDLIDVVTQDASMNMAIQIDKEILKSVTGSGASAAAEYTAAYANLQGLHPTTIKNNAGVNEVVTSFVADASGVGINLDGATKALETILQAGQVLDEANVPRDGKRFVIINPKVARTLKLSDLKQAQLTGDATSPLRNGLIGELDGMKIYVSNNLVNATASTAAAPTRLLVGHECAMTFASQFVKHEMMPLQDTFGYGVRGLKVYGHRVVKHDALVVILSA